MAIREQNPNQIPRRKDPVVNPPDENEDEIDVEAPGEAGEQRQGQRKPLDGDVEQVEDEEGEEDEDEVDGDSTR